LAYVPDIYCRKVRLYIVIRLQSEVIEISDFATPVAFNWPVFHQLEAELLLNGAMTPGSRSVAVDERCFGSMKYGIISAGYRIRMATAV